MTPPLIFLIFQPLINARIMGFLGIGLVQILVEIFSLLTSTWREEVGRRQKGSSWKKVKKYNITFLPWAEKFLTGKSNGKTRGYKPIQEGSTKQSRQHYVVETS